MAVNVQSRDGKSLMPCTEKRARLLTMRKRARVVINTPFTIRLFDRDLEDCILQDAETVIIPITTYCSKDNDAD